MAKATSSFNECVPSSKALLNRIQKQGGNAMVLKVILSKSFKVFQIFNKVIHKFSFWLNNNLNLNFVSFTSSDCFILILLGLAQVTG